MTGKDYKMALKGKRYISNRYEVQLQLNTDDGYILSPIWCPIHFDTYQAAKMYCENLKFRLDIRERYVVIDTLDDKIIFISKKD